MIQFGSTIRFDQVVVFYLGRAGYSIGYVVIFRVFPSRLSSRGAATIRFESAMLGL